MSNRTCQRTACLVIPAVLALAALLAGGCADKIQGPGNTSDVTVTADLKAGPAIQFRLTVWAADMDTVIAPMLPAGDRVAASLQIAAGKARHFLAEALNQDGLVLYSGEVVQDVVNLVPLDLTIPMPPVAPLLYLNPHFATVELGSRFDITINANDLPGLYSVGLGVVLVQPVGGAKASSYVTVDSVSLAPEQVSLGSSLSYYDYGTEIYVDVSNELDIVDAAGDAALAIIHCSTQDTWPTEPIDIFPNVSYVEVMSGVSDSVVVNLDSAWYRLVRPRVPNTYLGSPIGDDMGVALVSLGGGQTMLAGDVNGIAFNGDCSADTLFLARLGADPAPLWQRSYTWGDCLGSQAMASAPGGGYYVARGQSYGAGAVLRLDSAGDVDWYEDLSNVAGGSPYAVASRPGGGCVAAGSFPGDGLHFLLATFTAGGFDQAYTPTDFSADQQFLGVAALDDTTFAAAGYEYPYSSGGNIAVLGQYTQGSLITSRWERRFSGGYDQTFRAVLALPGGDVLAVGTVDSLGQGLGDVFAVRADRQGKVLWTRRFGTATMDEAAFGVCATPDGAFVAAGAQAAQRANHDVYLVKFDGAGRMIWQRSLGGPDDDVARAVAPDGAGLILTGYTSPGPSGSMDTLVLRLGADGTKVKD